jgi:hypothetical protein
MAFLDIAVQQRWNMAGARCECTQTIHGHRGRCNKRVTWGNRGGLGWGAWEAHHIGSPNDDSFSNCRIYCWECHKPTI